MGNKTKKSEGPACACGRGDLDQEEIDAIDEELVEKLIDRFPLLAEIFSEESLVFTGSRTKFSTGFRYSIQVGFHF